VYATQTIDGATAPSNQQRAGSARVPSTENDNGFEIFRRAIMLRDEAAWLEISLRYRPMLISWASREGSRGATDEHCDDIADRAFARAWAALSPERFAQFPNLSSLLGYLRTCVSATSIDMARSANARERAYQRVETSSIATPEDLVLERMERSELWHTAIEAAHSAQERVVLVENFLIELPPREILARHPDLFANIHEVYMAKRHLLSHLQRSAELRQFANG